MSIQLYKGYPVPADCYSSAFANKIMRDMYVFRWERVEREAAMIEAGEMSPEAKTAARMHLPWEEVLRRRKERDGDPKESRNERQRRYRVKLAASGLKRPDGTYASFSDKKVPSSAPFRCKNAPAPIDERELYGVGSLADRVRIVSDEEWARL